MHSTVREKSSLAKLQRTSQCQGFHTRRIRPGAAARRGWESSGRGDGTKVSRSPALAGEILVDESHQFGTIPKETSPSLHPETLGLGLDLNSDLQLVLDERAGSKPGTWTPLERFQIGSKVSGTSRPW